MGLLLNATRVHSITINGTDYTNNFIDFTCADSSAERAGIITTKGQLRLGYIAGGLDISEYKKLLFRRGQVVILNMQHPNGATFRHPRGYLYVLTSQYNPSDNTNTIEVGCRLALAELTNNVSNLLSYSTLSIPEERQDFSNLSSYIAVENAILYQNNQGELVKRQWFVYNITSGAWTSVLGQTAVQIAPLGGSSVVPDRIQLNYSVYGEEEDPEDLTIVTDTSTSDYFIQFPIKKFIRKSPTLGVAGITGSTATARASSNQDNCGSTITPGGNDPTEGRDNDTESCSSNFEVEESVTYISARNISTSTTYNTGPAGQVDRIIQEVRGPALELNTAYFTDKYSYCVQKYSTSCNPGGNCQPEGSNMVTQARQITSNSYDSSGAVSITVVENYKHLLAAAQPSDWRRITVDRETGEETEEFRDNLIDSIVSSDQMYLDSLQETYYQYTKPTGSKQITFTYTSLASRGIGISDKAKLNAYVHGILTTETRVSTTTSANPFNPDRTSEGISETSNTIELTFEVPLAGFGVRPLSTPPEVAPYTAVESLPIDATRLPSSQIPFVVGTYASYLAKWIKGTAMGLRITETLRPNLVNNWYPGREFFYVDDTSGEILVLKSDAHAWAVDQDGAAVTIAGLWWGISNGTYVPGST